VLRGAGDVFDFLSVHLYQPDRAGWQGEYDAEALFKTVCAAPLDAERMLERVSTQIKTLQPDKNIGIAFDEWNLWLPPADDAGSMHQVVYRMRDALYIAGMLNVFHRQCGILKIANLAQLVNVLPLIVTHDEGAFATTLYYPFLLYKEMKNVALRSLVRGKFYDSEALGNIAAVKDVPYIDISATRDNNGDKMILSIVNRHPTSRSFVDIELKGFPKMKLSEGWLMHNPDALAANTLDEPGNVKSKQVGMPEKRGSRFKLDLPPLSISILALNKL
jgi:alpha-N-arabinofuranosidase